MGKGESEIPSIVLSDEVLELGKESEAWISVRNKVREACERHGCFLVEYPNITKQLQEELFTSLKDFFDLPAETKRKYKKESLRDGGYVGVRPLLPLYETIGIGSPPEEEIQNLANQMWPEGNQSFCKVVNSMNSRLQELYFIILRLVFEGLAIEKHFEPLSKSTRFTTRASKYEALPLGDDYKDKSAIGLFPHVDRAILTFLCQNSVQGLEVLSSEGDWIEVAIPKGTCVVIVGDVFQVWSNGRYEPVKHRVVIKGECARYSYGLFSLPKDEITIEVPVELVDEEHPVKFRPFIYSEYHVAHATDLSPDALNQFAGVV